jgi:hypothetical protein
MYDDFWVLRKFCSNKNHFKKYPSRCFGNKSGKSRQTITWVFFETVSKNLKCIRALINLVNLGNGTKDIDLRSGRFTDIQVKSSGRDFAEAAVAVERDGD